MLRLLRLSDWLDNGLNKKMNDLMKQNCWLEGMTFCSPVLLKGAGTETLWLAKVTDKQFEEIASIYSLIRGATSHQRCPVTCPSP